MYLMFLKGNCFEESVESFNSWSTIFNYYADHNVMLGDFGSSRMLTDALLAFSLSLNVGMKYGYYAPEINP